MDAVARAFSSLPRQSFLPERERLRAHFDGPIPIGHGQTNSQPRTVADMLRLLATRPGDRVLDVGSGSGWTTALLAHLVGPTGSVLGLELDPALAEWGAANLAGTGQPWAEIRLATPGVLGSPEGAPYDRILVSAEARVLPEELALQLAHDPDDPGRMVVPVNGEMLLVVRRDLELAVTTHGRYRFVPLR